MVNLELYKTFVIVAKNNNITRASEILCISQPAVTKQIKKLEDQLNSRLFERTNSGMQLTSNGSKLFAKLENLIESIEKVEYDFINDRIIKVGTRVSILSKIFSKGISKYYNSFSNSKIEYKYQYIEEMLESLDEEQLDLVLTKRIDDIKYKNLKFISLGFLHDVFVTKKNSKYSKKVYSKKDLKNEIIYANIPNGNPVSTRVLKRTFGYEDLSNNKNIKPIGSNGIIEILKNEEAIGFLTKEFIQEELDGNKLEVLQISFEIEPTEYGIYYNKNNRFKQLNELIECIVEECKNI